MIYIRDIRRMVMMAVMLMTAVMVQAQYVTYNHDASVMNQFTIGEIGAGSFTPDLYYDAFHKVIVMVP